MFYHKRANKGDKYIASFDPGLTLGMLVRRNTDTPKTLIGGNLIIGKLAQWEEVCNNLFTQLDTYADTWNKLTTVLIERQTNTSEKITMIEAYLVAYFMRMDVTIISIDRRFIFDIMKQYIPGLKFKREILKEKFTEYAKQHIDPIGLEEINKLKRNHDIGDCFVQTEVYLWQVK